MSASEATNIEATVYVRLLEEGTDVWRPVRATALPDGTFELQRPVDYDPELESWEFPPEARVICAERRFADGDKGLAAIARAASADLPPSAGQG